MNETYDNYMSKYGLYGRRFNLMMLVRYLHQEGYVYRARERPSYAEDVDKLMKLTSLARVGIATGQNAWLPIWNPGPFVSLPYVTIEDADKWTKISDILGISQRGDDDVRNRLINRTWFDERILELGVIIGRCFDRIHQRTCGDVRNLEGLYARPNYMNMLIDSFSYTLSMFYLKGVRHYCGVQLIVPTHDVELGSLHNGGMTFPGLNFIGAREPYTFVDGPLYPGVYTDNFIVRQLACWNAWNVPRLGNMWTESTRTYKDSDIIQDFQHSKLVSMAMDSWVMYGIGTIMLSMYDRDPKQIVHSASLVRPSTKVGPIGIYMKLLSRFKLGTAVTIRSQPNLDYSVESDSTTSSTLVEDDVFSF
jgi:hypothetical protein